jgi:hypothetical protein
MILEELDRWIVQPRHVTVTAVSTIAGSHVEIHFDTDLHLQIDGSFELARSPRTDAIEEPLVTIDNAVGSRQGSLVLFNRGSIRLVLTDGIMLRASTESGGTISCYRPGDFRWESRDAVVERSRHVE